jgi:hypothetical protein
LASVNFRIPIYTAYFQISRTLQLYTKMANKEITGALYFEYRKRVARFNWVDKLRELRGFQPDLEDSVETTSWLDDEAEQKWYNKFIDELGLHHPVMFSNFFGGMSRETLEKMLNVLVKEVQTVDYLREVSPGQQMCVAIRHLAWGDHFKRLGFLFDLPRRSILPFLPAACAAIVKVHMSMSPNNRDFKHWLAVLSHTAREWMATLP